MSPVTMKLCGPFQAAASQDFRFGLGLTVPSACHRTVVSRVLGKAFSKILARSLSTILSFISSMTFSTSGDSKVRQYLDGLWVGSSSGPKLYGGLIGISKGLSIDLRECLLLAHGIVLVVRTCCFVLQRVDVCIERLLDLGIDTSTGR